VSKAPSAQEKYPTFLDDQRQFFDELITEEWTTYQSVDWDRRRRLEVDSLFRLVSPRRVLDVGCGCGFHDVLMAEKPGVDSVIGIDYSPKSIETATRFYAHPKVSRRVEDIATMSTREEFDLVTSFQVIEHLTDPAQFLRNCAGQVARGGWVAAVTPNRLRLSNRLRLLTGGHARLGDPQHFKEYIVSDLVASGRTAGLEYIGSFGYGLTLNIPRAGVSLLPSFVNLHLGRFLASAADCFGVVYRRFL
jgi:2-polyprenyl-3-methyl-5-hydroxy-6-metoxy-1,4-benzoquinol methylase